MGMNRDVFFETLPNCISGDREKMEHLFSVANAVAANCSASNSQVLEAMAVLLRAITEEAVPNEGLMAKVVDRIAG